MEVAVMPMSWQLTYRPHWCSTVLHEVLSPNDRDPSTSGPGRVSTNLFWGIEWHFDERNYTRQPSRHDGYARKLNLAAVVFLIDASVLMAQCAGVSSGLASKGRGSGTALGIWRGFCRRIRHERLVPATTRVVLSFNFGI